MAERKNNTFVESATSIIVFAKLPNYFWVKAMFIANYIQNKVPTSALDGIVKVQWTRRKPSILDLRTFGCDAYVHIPKEKRSKLDVKSQKCILVGYNDNHVKAYRLYNPFSKIVIISKDVIFHKESQLQNIRER